MATNTELEYLGRGATEQLVAEVKALLATKQDKGESSGSGGVSSWNDLTDKPFGEELSVVFDGVFQNVQVDDDGDGVNDMWSGEPMIVEDTSDAELVEGQTYTVTWDGVTYTTECVSQDGVCAIGNTELVMGTGDNGMPFVIIRDTGVWLAMLTSIQTDLTISGTYTCKIEATTVKTLDEKFLPPIKASWNDLTDKPFYEEGNLEEFFPEEDVGFVLGETLGVYMAGDAKPASLIIGETYTVHWDGVEYVCSAVDASSLNGGEEMIVIGNGTGFGLSGNNEPFAIITDKTDIIFVVTDPTDTSEYHTAEIFKGAITIKTIDPKFLPEGFAGGVSSWNDLTDKPFYEEVELTKIYSDTVSSSTFVTNEGLSCMQYSSIPSPFVLTEGETYRVVIDGTEYTSVCNSVDSNLTLDISVRDSSGELTAMVFILYAADIGDGQDSVIIQISGTETSHAVAIYHDTSTIKTIDPKFLPEGSLPEVTTTDAGKFLRVSVDGLWVAEAVPSAEEASF